MRVVIDTNVVVSGFLFNGPPTDVLEAVQSPFVELFTSDALLIELSDVLGRTKLQYRLKETGYTVEEILFEYRKMTTVVSSTEFSGTPHVRDPDDQIVLSTAHSAGARFIVSGDKDLLSVKQSSDIRIVSPVDFLKTAHIHRRFR